MAEVMHDGAADTARHSDVRRRADPTYQAFEILHWSFVALPTIVGLDKFSHWMARWTGYLAPEVSRALPVSAHAFMRAVGVAEIALGLLVALRPREGAYAAAVWLACIVANLVLAGGFIDVALRDVGLLLCALALARLASRCDPSRPRSAGAVRG